MSKAFTSEEAADGPLVVPARAPLPDGVKNYVTPRGLDLLRAEAADLDAERVRLADDRSDEAERRNRLGVLDQQIADLAGRIRGARVLDASKQPAGEVRFGATVTLCARTADGGAGEERRYMIVGVDEADAGEGRVAFVSPIARVLVGKRVGETALLRTARGEEALEITAIAYDADPGGGAAQAGGAG